jgi:hypothetical protein
MSKQIIAPNKKFMFKLNSTQTTGASDGSGTGTTTNPQYIDVTDPELVNITWNQDEVQYSLANWDVDTLANPRTLSPKFNGFERCIMVTLTIQGCTEGFAVNKISAVGAATQSTYLASTALVEGVHCTVDLIGMGTDWHIEVTPYDLSGHRFKITGISALVLPEGSTVEIV